MHKVTPVDGCQAEALRVAGMSVRNADLSQRKTLPVLAEENSQVLDLLCDIVKLHKSEPSIKHFGNESHA